MSGRTQILKVVEAKGKENAALAGQRRKNKQSRRTCRVPFSPLRCFMSTPFAFGCCHRNLVPVVFPCPLCLALGGLHDDDFLRAVVLCSICSFNLSWRRRNWRRWLRFNELERLPYRTWTDLARSVHACLVCCSWPLPLVVWCQRQEVEAASVGCCPDEHPQGSRGLAGQGRRCLKLVAPLLVNVTILLFASKENLR